MDIYDVNPDVFRRWFAISQLIPKGNFKILDIGGNPNDEQIKMFFGDNLEVINPQYTNNKTQDFKDKSFDFVISIDTLEHVAEKDRELFISEAIRLAKYKAIIACPFDEPFVADTEKLIYEISNNYNLREHIENGLPNLHNTLKVINDLGIHYELHDNDNLLSWASFLMLHQTNGNKPELAKFKRHLNKIYDVNEPCNMSYRKIIEIFKPISKEELDEFNQKCGKVESTEKQKRSVSIIIPTLALQFLDECIKSIEQTTNENYEIIIVNDGGANEDLLEYLDKTPYKTISTHKNLGFEKANNIGFKLAKYDYIMSLNADTILHQGCISKMLDTIESDDSIALVAPTNLMWNSNIISNQGCEFSEKERRIININQDIDYIIEKDKPFEVKFIGGCCMLFKRKPLFEVGLFDEEYLNGWEETDICMSLRTLGYKIYHSDGVLNHYGGFVRSGMQGYEEQVKNNMNLFVKKWLTPVIKANTEKEIINEQKI